MSRDDVCVVLFGSLRPALLSLDSRFLFSSLAPRLLRDIDKEVGELDYLDRVSYVNMMTMGQLLC